MHFLAFLLGMSALKPISSDLRFCNFSIYLFDIVCQFESIRNELESLDKVIQVEAMVSTPTSVSGMADHFDQRNIQFHQLDYSLIILIMQFWLIFFPPSRFRLFTDAFSMHVPCMHFSCHGEDIQGRDGCLLLEHESNDQEGQFGLAHSVKAEAFFLNLQNHDGAKAIEFVFVSACHSHEVGKQFEAFGIKHVIAVDQAQTINDFAAQRFSKTLYRMLFKGHTVRQAFDQAKLQLATCADVDYNGTLVLSNAPNQASRFELLGRGDHNRPLDFVRGLAKGDAPPPRSPKVSLYLPLNETFKIQPRQEDAFRLMWKMTHTQSKLLIVNGESGIGKSSLLLECAHYMSARGRQLAWIPCSDSSPAVAFFLAESFKDADFQSLDSLSGFIARALGFHAAKTFSDLNQLRDRLAKNWVVFDGVDGLSADRKTLLFAAKTGFITCLCSIIRVCSMKARFISFFWCT
jgi:hypothetical protein